MTKKVMRLSSGMYKTCELSMSDAGLARDIRQKDKMIRLWHLDIRINLRVPRDYNSMSCGFFSGLEGGVDRA